MGVGVDWDIRRPPLRLLEGRRGAVSLSRNGWDGAVTSTRQTEIFNLVLIKYSMVHGGTNSYHVTWGIGPT